MENNLPVDVINQQKHINTADIPLQNTLSQTIKQFLKFGNTKCPYSNNPAILICIKDKCKFDSPLMCHDIDCKCRIPHENCSERSVSNFLKVFQKQDEVIAKMTDVLTRSSDKLIDEISKGNQKLIQKTRSYGWLNSTSKDSIIQNKNQKQTEMKKGEKPEQKIVKINSSMLGQIWNSNINIQKFFDENIIRDDINSFEKQLIENINLHYKKIEEYLCKTRQKVVFNKYIGNEQQMFWNPQLKGSFIQINGLNLRNCQIKKKIQPESFFPTKKFAMLSPSISKMKGDKICWRIKIIKLQNSISLGICLKQLIKQKNFTFNINPPKDQQSGHYLLQSNGNTYMMKANLTNSVKGFVFKEGDIIDIEFNQKTSNHLSFKKVGTKQWCQLTNLNKLKESEDQYSICVVFDGGDNEIELVSPLKCDEKQIRGNR